MITTKVILFFALFFGAARALAQYTSESSDFDAGVGVQQAGALSNAGAFSDVPAQSMTSANYAGQPTSPVLPTAVQSPDLPALTITRAGRDIRIAWPDTGDEVTLQAAPAVGKGAKWSAVTGAFRQEKGERYLLVPATEAAHFYRLTTRQP